MSFGIRIRARISTRASNVYPGDFRIVANGQINAFPYSRFTPTGGSPLAEYTANSVPPGDSFMADQVKLKAGAVPTTWSSANNNNYIEVTKGAMSAAPSTSSANFWEPSLVGSSESTQASCASNCYQTGTNTAGAGARLGSSDVPFVGLFIGSSYAPDWNFCAGNIKANGTQQTGNVENGVALAVGTTNPAEYPSSTSTDGNCGLPHPSTPI